MRLDGSCEGTGMDKTSVLARRVRTHLCEISATAPPITYQALAKALGVVPPNTIHQLTDALECLIAEDAAAERPLIAALVISKARSGMPAPGFFECARRVGRFKGAPLGPEAAAFFAAELDAAVVFWGATTIEAQTDSKGPSRS